MDGERQVSGAGDHESRGGHVQNDTYCQARYHLGAEDLLALFWNNRDGIKN